MYQRILVPVDGSKTACRGLREAIQLAQITKGRIRLVHVDDELQVDPRDDLDLQALDDEFSGVEPGAKLLSQCLHEVELSGVTGDVVLRKGIAGVVYQEIALEAKDWCADIIVLGTHARSGLPRFAFGSNGDEILHCSNVPVLQVKL
ncbi:nucleotide-binding universal stress UspA family protein [Variovorax sp. GrIS 2.14]|uniref:universal stress protein n=1 Tax=Variovorax sp. GrIS 2.14 TaxID=3071709 RepID=UPI0038F806FD